jgi:hypothetical protein
MWHINNYKIIPMLTKQELSSILLLLFQSAELDEGKIIPHSLESINEIIEEQYDSLKPRLINMSSENEVDLYYELFEAVILKELYKITWELDKQGLVETTVNKNGDICFKTTAKGIDVIKNNLLF